MGSSGVVISGRASALGEQAVPYKGTGGPEEVDIVTGKYAYANSLVAEEDPDATEYSSSFVDTTCDTERGSGFSEAEVESQFFGDSALTSPYDEFSSIFQTRKKKKLTNHWRNYIRPLMWRCKWTEIKMKEFESQRSKYARKLAEWEQETRPRGYPQATLEGHCSKSLPFSNPSYRRKAVKRRKRKRVEDTTDATAYMSDHVIFAYAESKRSIQDGSCILDDLSNTVTQRRTEDDGGKFGIDSDKFTIDVKESDLEKVLRTIEVVQSRVQKLKTQLDLVIPTNAARFSSSENLSLLAPFDGQTGIAHSPTFSACNGETCSVGGIDGTQHMSAYDFGDLVLPDSAISSYGEAIFVPDIIESTVSLLSSADVTFHQPQVGDSCEDMVDNILMHNEVTERHALTGTSEPIVEGHHLLSRVKDEESGDLYHTEASEVGSVVMANVIPKEEPGLQSSLHSDLQLVGSKRKRGERKVGSVGWSKKSSDDQDSQ